MSENSDNFSHFVSTNNTGKNWYGKNLEYERPVMKFIDQYVFGLSAFLSLVQYGSGETFGKYFELILGGGQASQTRLSSSACVGRRQLPPSWRFASVMA